jgi:hypothetical protein
MPENALQYEIEELIDKHGLHDVTRALTDTCIAKGDHLRDNWQDKAGAKIWLSAAKIIDHASAKISELPLP